MSDILRIVSTILLLDLALGAYFMVIPALFPARVFRVQGALDRAPGRSFILGLVNFLFFAALALVLFSLANRVDGLFKALFMLPALLLTALLLISLSFGLAATSNLVGLRLFPAHSPWQRTLWGALLLGIACALPVAGWFLLFPYAGLSGIGGFILTFFQKEPPAG